VIETASLDQIEMLRAQLETVLPAPCLLVLSSARDDDGKNLVASALARCMAVAGYSTLLVLADDQKRSLDNVLDQPASLKEVYEQGVARFASGTSPCVMALSSRRISYSVSREDVARFGEACRDSFQITILEAASILTNSFAMLAALNADAVLLTIREGRRVCAQDRLLARLLAREKAPFLGVVSVEAAAIVSEQTAGPPPKELPRTPLPVAGVTRAPSVQEKGV
jgi:hypothetical protein